MNSAIVPRYAIYLDNLDSLHRELFNSLAEAQASPFADPDDNTVIPIWVPQRDPDDEETPSDVSDSH